MVIATGLAALNSIKSLYEIIKEVRDSNDSDRLRVAAQQMFDLALAAREQTALLIEERNALKAELDALKGKIKEFDTFETQAPTYVRQNVGAGAFVYRVKEPAAGEGPSPYFCPGCFGNRKISIFQPAAGANTRLGHFDWVCGGCGIKTVLPRMD